MGDHMRPRVQAPGAMAHELVQVMHQGHEVRTCRLIPLHIEAIAGQPPIDGDVFIPVDAVPGLRARAGGAGGLRQVEPVGPELVSELLEGGLLQAHQGTRAIHQPGMAAEGTLEQRLAALPRRRLGRPLPMHGGPDARGVIHGVLLWGWFIRRLAVVAVVGDIHRDLSLPSLVIWCAPSGGDAPGARQWLPQRSGGRRGGGPAPPAPPVTRYSPAGPSARTRCARTTLASSASAAHAGRSRAPRAYTAASAGRCPTDGLPAGAGWPGTRQPPAGSGWRCPVRARCSARRAPG